MAKLEIEEMDLYKAQCHYLDDSKEWDYYAAWSLSDATRMIEVHAVQTKSVILQVRYVGPLYIEQPEKDGNHV